MGKKYNNNNQFTRQQPIYKTATNLEDSNQCNKTAINVTRQQSIYMKAPNVQDSDQFA